MEGDERGDGGRTKPPVGAQVSCFWRVSGGPGGWGGEGTDPDGTEGLECG